MIVGTAAVTKTWHLPKELLTNSSPFFAAALNGSFAEAKSKIVSLPEDSINAFEMFIQWLYVGEIAAKDCFADHDHGDHYPPYICSKATVQTFIEAWILGDKLRCPVFKDLAMLGLIRTLESELIYIHTVRTAYERSAPGSKLRKIVLDQVRYDAWAGGLGDDTDEWMVFARECVDFGEDLVRATFQQGSTTLEAPLGQKALYLDVLMVENTSG